MLETVKKLTVDIGQVTAISWSYSDSPNLAYGTNYGNVYIDGNRYISTREHRPIHTIKWHSKNRNQFIVAAGPCLEIYEYNPQNNEKVKLLCSDCTMPAYINYLAISPSGEKLVCSQICEKHINHNKILFYEYPSTDLKGWKPSSKFISKRIHTMRWDGNNKVIVYEDSNVENVEGTECSHDYVRTEYEIQPGENIPVKKNIETIQNPKIVSLGPNFGVYVKKENNNKIYFFGDHQHQHRIKKTHQGEIEAIWFSDDGKWFSKTKKNKNGNRFLALLNMQKPSKWHLVNLQNSISKIAFSPSKNHIAIVSNGSENVIQIYKLKTIFHNLKGAPLSVIKRIKQLIEPNIDLGDHENKLVELLENQARSSGDIEQFFINAIYKTSWPNPWKSDLVEQLEGRGIADTRKILEYTKVHRRIPGNPKYTALGDFLVQLTPDLDFENRLYIAFLIVKLKLIKDQSIISNHMMRYNILDTRDTTDTSEEIRKYGPEFNWMETEHGEDLESFLRPVQDYPVDFLIEATKCAASVCKIEIPGLNRYGTGFLISPNLVITNHHVIKQSEDEDLNENARSALLTFGNYKADMGELAPGIVINVNQDEPVVEYSPTDSLDFVLLSIESNPNEDVEPLKISKDIPKKYSPLNIIQHPGNQEMKVSLARNGITAINKGKDRIQYVTHTARGSSGSPCFNNNWELVGLHHAGIEETVIKKGQGILFSSIYQQINEFID
jgi:V8-like Glu-specific endopeptidase/WD40 repeat protein